MDSKNSQLDLVEFYRTLPDISFCWKGNDMCKKSNVKGCLVMGIFLLMMVGTARARIITVGLEESYDFNTIQAAIDDANNGDTIEVQPGRYTGTGNRDIDFKGKAIIVRSIDPNDPNVVAATIIDCNGTRANPHRGFYFHCGETPYSILAGLTIMNGYGLGVFDGWGRTNYVGGGIYCVDSSPTISNCIIRNNKAEWGGGICCRHSSTTVKNCIIANNEAHYYFGGGGIYIWTESSFTISNCIITGNKVSGYYSAAGGGITCSGPGNLIISHCRITGNASDRSGGGIQLGGVSSAISNCTITGNSAKEEGGGLLCYDTEPTIANSILWGNSAAKGPQIAIKSKGDPSHATVSYSDIDGGQAAIYIEERCTLTWGDGNIDTDPCFAKPGHWVDKNDPNIIVEPNDPNALWADGDYHLKSQAGRWDANEGRWTKDDVTSPCIDAGDPASPIGYEPFPNGGIINMGVYGGTSEASKSYFGEPVCEIIVAGDINGDCRVDFEDLALMALHWLGRGEVAPPEPPPRGM
jgi:hypothetical protein